MANSNIHVAGSTVYVTQTTMRNPPLFVAFGCSAADTSLSDCSNPTGLGESIAVCGRAVIGVECIGKSQDFMSIFELLVLKVMGESGRLKSALSVASLWL